MCALLDAAASSPSLGLGLTRSACRSPGVTLLRAMYLHEHYVAAFNKDLIHLPLPSHKAAD